MNYNESKYLYSYQGSVLEIQIKSGLFSTKRLSAFCRKEKVVEYCKKGCPYYSVNLSCPPFSPDFNHYASSFSEIFVLLAYISLDQLIFLPENDQMRSGYAIVKSFVENEIRSLEKSLLGKMITGSCCDLCGTCSSGICIKPMEMRYNFTSLGMQMDFLSKELFEHTLLWSDEKKSADYITCFGGVLFNPA